LPPSARSEQGFTLVELIVAVTVGTIVMLASLALLDMTVNGQRDAELRVDALDNGRRGMEQISRQIRSQICLGRGVAPVITAQDDQIEFYASLARDPGTAPLEIQRRRLQFVEDGRFGRGRIEETVWVGSGTLGSGTPITWPTPPRVRTVIADIRRTPGRPIFRYWKYDPDTSPDVIALTTPVAAPDIGLIVQVGVAFEAWAQGRNAARHQTALDSRIFVRTADPTDPERSPRCI
jgi:prepilin-type N-terminal cleavage/methylation domain-containing protein